jgi:hypothetical protein
MRPRPLPVIRSPGHSPPFSETDRDSIRTKDPRLESTDYQEGCLAINSVVAWGVYWTTKQGVKPRTLGVTWFKKR